MFNGTAEWAGASVRIALPQAAREVISPDVPMRVLVTAIASPALLYIDSIEENHFTVERMQVPGLETSDSVTFHWLAITRVKGAEQRRQVSEAFENAIARYPKIGSLKRVGSVTETVIGE